MTNGDECQIGCLCCAAAALIPNECILFCHWTGPLLLASQPLPRVLSLSLSLASVVHAEHEHTATQWWTFTFKVLGVLSPK